MGGTGALRGDGTGEAAAGAGGSKAGPCKLTRFVKFVSRPPWIKALEITCNELLSRVALDFYMPPYSKGGASGDGDGAVLGIAGLKTLLAFPQGAGLVDLRGVGGGGGGAGGGGGGAMGAALDALVAAALRGTNGGVDGDGDGDEVGRCKLTLSNPS